MTNIQIPFLNVANSHDMYTIFSDYEALHNVYGTKSGAPQADAFAATTARIYNHTIT